MQPVLPHLISECLKTLGENIIFDWPQVNKKFLDKKTTNIVVQFNGKKRGLILCDYNINEKDLINKIKKESELQKYFTEKKILRNIYVQNKLINFILK